MQIIVDWTVHRAVSGFTAIGPGPGGENKKASAHEAVSTFLGKEHSLN